MSNIRNLNQQSDPMADFISSIAGMASNHPFFAAYNTEPSQTRGEASSSSRQAEEGASGDKTPAPTEGEKPAPPQGEDPFERGFPFRGHRGPHGHHHHGPPPHCGRRGGRGGFASGPRGGPPGAGFAGPWGMGGAPWAGNMDFGNMAEAFKSYLGNIADLNNDTTKKEDGAQTDFNPPIDLFDTSEAYHIHVSLPGAKKEDIGVSYDADNSQVNIAGVVHRPGDEDFQKTLAMGERKVGVFERKVKLGTRAEPANVDADGISAKMEDGVLKVNVPKEEGGFVDVRKVDIE